MKSSTFSIFCILFFASNQALAVDCIARFSGNIKTRGSLCSEWKSKPVMLTSYNDGTMVPNPARANEVLPKPFQDAHRIQNPNETQVRLMMEEIDRLKQSMLDQVIANLPESQWNDHQAYLARRLRTLRVVVWPNTDLCNLGLNAQYNPGAHRLEICPIATYMPIETLVALFSHELGHLGDPCNYLDRFPYSQTMKTTDGEVNVELVRRNIRRCLNNSADSEKIITFMTAPSRVSARAAQFWRGPTKDQAVSRQDVERLRGCGIVEAMELAPTTYENSPYLHQLACLTDKFPTAAEVGLNQRLKLSLARQSITPNMQIPAASAGPICRGQPMEHTKECTADHIGASLLKFHLDRHQDRYAAERRSLFTYFLSQMSCDSDGMVTNSYPSPATRMRTLMEIPIIREWSGCTLEPGSEACTLDTRSPAGMKTAPKPAKKK